MRKTLLALLACTITTPLFAALPSGWVGRDTCATCHDDVAKAFVEGPHGRAMATRGHMGATNAAPGEPLDRSCETCHGAGEAHANDPSTKNIRTLKGDTKDASKGCITCHAAQEAGLSTRTSGHVRAGIACLDCHVPGHTAPAAEPLLARPRRELCTPCHATQVAQNMLPYAHREGRTPFECTSCHVVHGGTTVKGHIENDGQERCVTCHIEKAGPYVYPHPPREVNGCVSCHQPHGSPNPMLLVRSDTTQLCLECHTNTPSFHDLSRPTYRPCVNCHAAVHGSQRDATLFKE